MLALLSFASGACSSSGAPEGPGEKDPDASAAFDAATPRNDEAGGDERVIQRPADASGGDATKAPGAADAANAQPDATALDASKPDATAAPDGAQGDGAAPARDAGGARDAQADAGGGSLSDGGDSGGAPAARIVGRTVAGTAGPRFEWSGTNVSARFSGTQVSVQLNDASNLNEFSVVVDGAVLPNLVTRPGTTLYPVAAGLANGNHEVVLWRRTEASYGFTEFLGYSGFSTGGGLLAPPSAPAHQMEIVGDSISCGFGIEGTASCTNAQLETIENNYLAYGSVAARALGADVVTVAWSGIGVYRNFNEVGPSTNTMPQRYDFAIPTTSTAWDFSQYQPGAVVINLTSNDFSTFGDPGQAYIDAFVAFVQHIRTRYPGTYFFLVIEWRGNGSDSGPDVNAVVSAVKAAGDSRIESFDIRPFANGNGCQGHPDVAGGQAMGAALAAEIQRVLSW